MSVDVRIPLSLQLLPDMLSDGEYVPLQGLHVLEDLMIDPLEDISYMLRAIGILYCDTEGIIDVTVSEGLHAHHFPLEGESIQDGLIVFCHN